jgi:hypothetical protein
LTVLFVVIIIIVVAVVVRVIFIITVVLVFLDFHKNRSAARTSVASCQALAHASEAERMTTRGNAVVLCSDLLETNAALYRSLGVNCFLELRHFLILLSHFVGGGFVEFNCLSKSFSIFQDFENFSLKKTICTNARYFFP